ncbi:1-deoxy-D-xylulose-5-phosphate synthase [Acholeplasma sp. OttesenSCG-928-E16]|nr:1-deoxy-D-xylulose-5-phosphate synthase [Acholeplasma sp. OttesenSCG-928-E16]
MDLKKIKDPTFLKELSMKELQELALEIRTFIVQNVSKTGGHLASNLGTVELTIALHYVFNDIKDSILFDVGHQTYTHKILTGRAKDFDTLRKTDGLSGFSCYQESKYDKWESGHAGTAISAATGILYANQKAANDGSVVAVVGDSSIVNGTSFEALNLLSNTNFKGIIVLNDNKMSISKPVGGFSNLLTRSRGTKFIRRFKKVSQIIFPKFMHRFFGRLKRGIKGLFQMSNIFEDLGYVYIGPYDGHDIKGLIYVLEKARRMNRATVVHILTEKGHGYQPAVLNPTSFHGVSKFDLETGEVHHKEMPTFSEVITKILIDLHKKDPFFVVMPAMTVGSHFMEFENTYKDYFIDVGIAEEHAASLSAALAMKEKVFLAYYSTFAQRAFDQIINDICRSNFHVVIGIDRSGLVPDDGSTHQGIYDVSMFSLMPNIIITMPYDAKEAASLLDYGMNKQTSPFVIRYPKGCIESDLGKETDFVEIKPSYSYLKKGNLLNIISYGRSLDLILDVCNEDNIDASVINARFIKPIPINDLHLIFQTGKPILVYEESYNAPLFLDILKFKNENNYQNKIISMSIIKPLENQGSYQDLLKKNMMDETNIRKVIKDLLCD